MTILVPQQNLLGAGGILQSKLSALTLPLQTLNPLSIFTGATTGASCCSSANYPQTYCDNNQGIIQMMMGMFTMMMSFMQNMIGSMFNQEQNCGCQNQQQPIIINNIYNDYSDKSVHNTTNKYITNKYTTKNYTTNNYTTNNQYNSYTTNNTKNNYYDIDTTNIQNNNYQQINNTLNKQKNINNIYDTKVNNTNITDIDNVLNQTFVA